MQTLCIEAPMWQWCIPTPDGSATTKAPSVLQRLGWCSSSRGITLPRRHFHPFLNGISRCSIIAAEFSLSTAFILISHFVHPANLRCCFTTPTSSSPSSSSSSSSTSASSFVAGSPQPPCPPPCPSMPSPWCWLSFLFVSSYSYSSSSSSYDHDGWLSTFGLLFLLLLYCRCLLLNLLHLLGIGLLFLLLIEIILHLHHLHFRLGLDLVRLHQVDCWIVLTWPPFPPPPSPSLLLMLLGLKPNKRRLFCLEGIVGSLIDRNSSCLLCITRSLPLPHGYWMPSKHKIMIQCFTHK